MPKPSLRRNLLALVGLYACSLVVAAGCPTATPPVPPASKAATSAGAGVDGPAAKDEATADAATTSEADGKPAENAAESGAGVAAAKPADGAQTATDDPNITQVAAIDPATDKPAAKGAAGHSLRKPALDPVTVNGKYFEGWKKPKVALVFTGRQDGYLEPCGCAGLENQKGGLSRRHELFKQLRKQGWNLVPLDAGGLVRRFGKQAELQFLTASDALKPNAKAARSLGYAAVGFGANDLRLSAGEVAAVVAPNPPEESMYVSANVNVLGLPDDARLTPRFRIIDTADLKIGVTSILGEQFAKEVNNPEVEIEPAAKALAKVMPKLKDCDVKILLSNATTEESIALAKEFPSLDYVVLGGGVEGDPPAEAKVVEGTNVKLIDVAHKAMFAIVIGLFDDPKQPVRYQRVALDSRFKDSDEMKALMTNYQGQLESLGWSGLGLKPAPHPRSTKSDKLAGKFIGSESCKDCHQDAFDVWAASKHAHATETLVDLVPPRQYDPECISCHATGWNAQDYFPYVSGFDSLKKTPHLVGNGCENCHGPGAAHVSAENGENEDLQKKFRELMKYTTAQAEDSRQENSCYKCHDHDNSPEFKFESYWKEIAH